MAKQTTAKADSSLPASGAPQLLEMQPGQLTVFTLIGRGRFKTVSSGRHSRHGIVAAVQYKSESHRNEVKILSHLIKSGGHANIIEVYGCRREPSGFMMAEELSTFGSVRSVLQDPELGPMITLGHKLHMARQFAEAVSFLESAYVVHADLACRNFLVFQLEEEPKRTKVKLTDFISSLVLKDNVDHIVKKMPQATRWCAPETIASNTWSYKTDVWSVGATLWELFADGAVPWTNYSKRSEVARKLQELDVLFAYPGSRADLSEDFPAPQPHMCPTAVHNIVLSCLQPNASARPSSQELAVILKRNQLPSTSPPSSQVVHERGKVLARPLSARAQEWRMHAQESSVVMYPNGTANHQQGLFPLRKEASPSSEQHEKHQEWCSMPPQQTPFSMDLLANAFERLEGESSSSKPCSYLPTPPTRCSSVECQSVDSFDIGSGLQSFRDDDASLTTLSRRASTDRSNPAKMTAHGLETLGNMRTLLASGELPRNAESIENMKAFLSSPEAVCGLGAEKLLTLRRMLSAAQEGAKSQVLPGKIVACDTLLPLFNTWVSTPGCLVRDPMAKRVIMHPRATTTCAA
jgi:serine/threonine protein kinase